MYSNAYKTKELLKSFFVKIGTGIMLCNKSKSGACHYPTNQVLSNFLVQIHIFAPNYSEGGYFFNKKQIWS